MLQHDPIVKDETLNKQLFEKGYIVLPFLNHAEVEQLRDIYFSYHADASVEGLYVSSHAKPWDELMEISNKLKDIVAPNIDTHFQNVQKIGGTFIVKAPDENNILHPHQDWRIVDEDHYRSFTIWIALQDTTDENGAMYVLPGSHEWIRGYRHITIPSVYGKIYDLTWQYMLPIHLKAGEVVVFDHALVHASKPNISKELRIAATNTIMSEGATFRICCNNDGVVEEYECPSGFYIKPESRTAPFNLPKIKILILKWYSWMRKAFLHLLNKKTIKKVTKCDCIKN
jgi:hypothetical protein